MNQRDLVRELRARIPGLTVQMGNAVITALFRDIIPGALTRGESVSLAGWGTFAIRKRAPRKGRNPKTQSPMVIPATVVPVFEPGETLRERIRQSAAAQKLLAE